MTDTVTLGAPDALVQVQQRGAVRVLTLNRPASLNSFTQAMHAELREALDAAADDQRVRAVVITGNGRGFCAGQDLNDPAMAAGADGRIDIGAVIESNYQPLALRLQSMPVPVVAAVNGVAAGAGANFAFCCDMVLAARSASFIQAFSTIGLIWQVQEDAALMDAAFALADRLAAQPTKALVATRRALDAAQALPLEGALELEARLQRELGHANDFAEGVAAFQQKRAPKFGDR